MRRKIHAAHDAEQPPLGVADDGGTHVAALKSLEQSPGRRVGTDRRGSRLHDRLRGGVRVAVQRRRGQPAEQHPAVAHDERERVRRCVHALANVTDAVVKAAGDRVRAGEVDGARLRRLLAFAGQAAGQPVGLARRVVVDVLEAERVEPARGSRTEVS